MFRRKATTVAVGAAILSSCATVKNNYVPEVEQISFPELNKTNSVSLGEDLLRQGTATTTRGVLLNQQNKIGNITLSAGFYPQTGVDPKKNYVFTRFQIGGASNGIGQVSVSGGLGGFGGGVGYPSAIRFSTDKQQTCAMVTNIYGITQAACDTEYDYTFTERPLLSDNDFQQTLIYSGRVGDKVKISYREFSGNRARSAFTNDAEYDLSLSNEMAYKGAKIRVIKADNQNIEYVVLSNFNTTD